MVDPAALLFLTLISANVRSCLRPSSTLRALELLLYLSRTLTDETSLDRILPYIIYFLGDDVASVRAMAIRSLTQLVRFLPWPERLSSCAHCFCMHA